MRPKLDLKLNPKEFINYYWLKEELYAFCKEKGLPSNGSKDDLTIRIYEYLKSGKIISIKKNKIVKPSTNSELLTLESKIPIGYKNDEKHRAFFKSVIGKHFKFNVQFMNWMKANTGKTYNEAVFEWNKIINKKKKGKKNEIAPQFQYNQYTRDFFKDNPNATRDDLIKCWKHKKLLPGHNKYEQEDLIVLKQ